MLISTRRPTRGAIAVVEDKYDNSFCTTFVEVFRPNKNVSSEYLKFALRNSFSKLQFQRYSTFTSYPVISHDDIGKIVIPIPKKKTTQETTISESIGITQKIVQLKKEISETYSRLESEVSDSIYGELKL